jgi:hypothetical protein
MFLHVVGHNQRFRVVHQSFRRSIETVNRVFHQVLYAIGELRTEMIKPPIAATHPKIMGSQRWYPYMQVLVNPIFCLRFNQLYMFALIHYPKHF